MNHLQPKQGDTIKASPPPYLHQPLPAVPLIFSICTASGSTSLPSTRSHDKGNHAITGKEFSEFLNETGATVTDVVVAVITEHQSRLACFCRRHKRRGVNRIAQQTVRLAHLIGGLPYIRLVGILQLADCRQGLVVDDKGRTLAVRALEGV